MNEAEAKDRRLSQQLCDKYHKALAIYRRAREEAIAEVEESLDHLFVASEEILVAYKKSLAVLMEYTTPYPKPGDPVPPLPGESDET